MAERIYRIDPATLAQIMGPDEIAAVPNTNVPGAVAGTEAVQNTFDDILSKAVKSLEDVSAVENNANKMMEQYAKGEVELSDVVIASAKMGIAVQLAVTTVNAAVTTFKELTQMQV